MKRNLGCGHRIHEGEFAAGVRAPGRFLPVPGFKNRLGTFSRCSVRCMEYEVVSFVDQCVEAYASLAGVPATKLSPKTQTPLLDESNARMKDEPEGLSSNFCQRIRVKIH